MSAPNRDEITRLLSRWSGGDEDALNDLLPAVYEELQRLARSYMRRERGEHTLETRALVHEAFLRLVGQEGNDFESRSHFYGIAARTMRQILVDYARQKDSKKRGGDAWLVAFEEALDVGDGKPADILKLDEALNALAQTDPEKARLVELRFFVGLTHSEIADINGVSLSTVDRQWRLTRAWLFNALSQSS